MKLARPATAVALVLSLLAAPLAAEAQQAGRVYRIGLFHVGLDHVPPALNGLREGLKGLGYEEGKNLRWDFRNLPDEQAAQATAREFVRQRVDVIVAFENQTVRAAKAATSEIAILFLHVLTDPVGEGFVQSLTHPGGNITGIFGDVPAKRVELLKEVMPRLERLLLVFDPLDPTSLQELAAVRAAATARKLQLVERAAGSHADIERVFTSAKRENIQAVVVVSGLVTKFSSLVIRLAAERRLPIPRNTCSGRSGLYIRSERLTKERRRPPMPDKTYKIIELVGVSEESIQQAIRNAVARAAESLKGLDWFEMTEVRGLVKDGKVSQFQVKVKVGFRSMSEQEMRGA